MFASVRKCSQVFKDVRRCSRVFAGVQGWSQAGVRKCLKVVEGVRKITGRLKHHSTTTTMFSIARKFATLDYYFILYFNMSFLHSSR